MIKFKRQDGGPSSSNIAREPTSLAYGEPAIASDGTIYVGDGSGKVKSLVLNAKKAFNATNGKWQFVGDFKTDSWILKESTYEQTAQVKCLDSDNVVMSYKAKLSAPSTSQTDDFLENENKLDAIGIINLGKCIPGDGEITIKCSEKPNVDLDVYWDAKLDGEYTEEEENMYVQNAFQYSEQAKRSEKNCEVSSNTSKSWAVGDTGIRDDESINNAKYWCEQAQKIAQGAMGWYETENSLKSLYPVGENGQWAIVGSTDTIWTWDEDTGAWVDTGAQIDLSNYYTRPQADARFQLPVGYIFDWAPVAGQSADLSTPEKVAQHFGYGTWQEITGRFTFGRDASHEVGSTGGEEKHALTADENGPHTHAFTNKGGNVNIGSTWYATSNYGNGNAPDTNILGTQSSGQGAPHNNMPPYLAVYKWQRVA